MAYSYLNRNLHGAPSISRLWPSSGHHRLVGSSIYGVPMNKNDIRQARQRRATMFNSVAVQCGSAPRGRIVGLSLVIPQSCLVCIVCIIKSIWESILVSSSQSVHWRLYNHLSISGSPRQAGDSLFLLLPACNHFLFIEVSIYLSFLNKISTRLF